MKNLVENEFHQTVLLHEAIKFLDIKPGRWYVDATLGGGGHAAEILKKGGRVIGIDRDKDALESAKKYLFQVCPNIFWQIFKGNYKQIVKLVCRAGVKSVAGVIFDLGVSAYQLTGHQRGFSLQEDEPLDMRMDRENQKVTARDLISGLYEKELSAIFSKYAQERLAGPIARRIIITRRSQPIATTGELRDLVARVYKKYRLKRSKIDPATKVFQALRIAVNDELENLQTGLNQAKSVLAKNGRIVVISFHSLEDKIVKNKFKLWQERGNFKILTKKPVRPSFRELNNNPRSRSAKMRAIERLT